MNPYARRCTSPLWSRMERASLCVQPSSRSRLVARDLFDDGRTGEGGEAADEVEMMMISIVVVETEGEASLDLSSLRASTIGIRGTVVDGSIRLSPSVARELADAIDSLTGVDTYEAPPSMRDWRQRSLTMMPPSHDSILLRADLGELEPKHATFLAAVLRDTADEKDRSTPFAFPRRPAFYWGATQCSFVHLSDLEHGDVLHVGLQLGNSELVELYRKDRSSPPKERGDFMMSAHSGRDLAQCLLWLADASAVQLLPHLNEVELYQRASYAAEVPEVPFGAGVHGWPEGVVADGEHFERVTVYDVDAAGRREVEVRLEDGVIALSFIGHHPRYTESFDARRLAQALLVLADLADEWNRETPADLAVRHNVPLERIVAWQREVSRRRLWPTLPPAPPYGAGWGWPPVPHPS